MLLHVFYDIGRYWNTDKFKTISDQDKKAIGSLKGGLLHTRDLERKSGRGTHKGGFYVLGSRNNLRRLQSGLEGIGSSSQAEALDGVQIAAMLDQIAKLKAALAESEWRRVAEQESMSKTIQQIQKQLNCRW
ncbi:hypothetical protein H5410_027864 [Solanum commersonii]|uniref:Uncharacterized protein n=1 Tax=Solanum commersonii TaxID=4109 RepID=A0A9J5Z4L1_SOLCO|nr:hypothetical protein H5410_027864 [Solanum commersonii]